MANTIAFYLCNSGHNIVKCTQQLQCKTSFSYNYRNNVTNDNFFYCLAESSAVFGHQRLKKATKCINILRDVFFITQQMRVLFRSGWLGCEVFLFVFLLIE